MIKRVKELILVFWDVDQLEMRKKPKKPDQLEEVLAELNAIKSLIEDERDETIVILGDNRESYALMDHVDSARELLIGLIEEKQKRK